MQAISRSFSDDAGVRGSVEIIKRRVSDGAVVEHVEDHNIVVNGGRQALAHLFGGDWRADTGTPRGYCTEMRFGDRGHQTADPTLPKASAVTRTQLFCIDEARPYLITKSPLTVDYPSTLEVRFTTTVGAAEGNTAAGSAGYSEVGLYRADGTLAAHKTFGLITKTDDFEITFRWKFTF